MIMSLLELYKVTDNKKYFDFAEKYIDHRIEEDGTIVGYKKEELNLDNINEGKNLFTLYDLTGKENMLKRLKKYISRFGNAAYKGREFLAQNDLSSSGLAGRFIYGSALLYGI